MALAASGNLYVQDTTITRGGSANNTTGIKLNTTTGLLLATLDNVRLEGLTVGLDVLANSRVTISNSVVSGNLQNGILAGNATSVINVEGTQVSFNELVGVNASVSGSLIRLANNEIYNNSTGISIAAGATVSSAGNNRVAGNGASAAPNGAAIPLQ